MLYEICIILLLFSPQCFYSNSWYQTNMSGCKEFIIGLVLNRHSVSYLGEFLREQCWTMEHNAEQWVRIWWDCLLLRQQWPGSISGVHLLLLPSWANICTSEQTISVWIRVFSRLSRATAFPVISRERTRCLWYAKNVLPMESSARVRLLSRL